MTRTERTYYVVLGNYALWMWFIAPMYPLFLASRGLDLFQVNLVLACFMIATFALEVPTGAVADVFGRKISFVLGCGIRSGAFVLYSFADGLTDCLVAELIDALGWTLTSGSLDAWAVDGVAADGDRRPTDRMFARGQMISRTLMIAGGVAAGYLSDVDLTLPWLVAAAGYASTGVLAAVSMRETRPVRGPNPVGVRRSVARQVAIGMGTLRSSPVVRLFCILAMLLGFAFSSVMMTWPPRMKALSGEGFWLLGWIWALLNVVALLGSASTTALVARFGRARTLCGAQLWRAAWLGLAAWATGLPVALGALLVFEFGTGVDQPASLAWLNEHVPSGKRATVLSLSSMFFTLGSSTGLVVLGMVANSAGIPGAWLASATVLLLVAPGYLLVGRLARSSPVVVPA